MQNVSVSILIANYNNSQYIVETLDSIINQTYKDFEIIIVDDFSTDDSIPVIEKFIYKFPTYDIKFYKNFSNYGCGRTKRKCVDIARGDLYAFLDPDDTISPNTLELLVQQHILHPEYSIVYTAHYYCNEKLEPQSISLWPGEIPEDQSHLTSTRGHISAFALCKKKFYDLTTGIDPKFIVAEDQDIYLKMEEVAPVCFIDQPLYFYRKHENNISWNDNKKIDNAYWLLIAREDAYNRRRKYNLPIANLTNVQIKREKLLFYLLLFETKFVNKEYIISIKFLFKALFLSYTDNNFYIIKKIKRVLNQNN